MSRKRILREATRFEETVKGYEIVRYWVASPNCRFSEEQPTVQKIVERRYRINGKKVIEFRKFQDGKLKSISIELSNRKTYKHGSPTVEEAIRVWKDNIQSIIDSNEKENKALKDRLKKSPTTVREVFGDLLPNS